MVGLLVSDEDFVIACRSRTCSGLKIPLLECIVIGCLGAIGCVVGMGGGETLTRVEAS